MHPICPYVSVSTDVIRLVNAGRRYRLDTVRVLKGGAHQSATVVCLLSVKNVCSPAASEGDDDDAVNSSHLHRI
jgi:hypothetical protein